MILAVIKMEKIEMINWVIPIENKLKQTTRKSKVKLVFPGSQFFFFCKNRARICAPPREAPLEKMMEEPIPMKAPPSSALMKE